MIICNDQNIPVNFFTIGNLLFGFLLYRFGFSLQQTIIFYTLFEILQNIVIRIHPIGNLWRKLDTKIANKIKHLSLKWKPYYGDSLINSIIDIIAGLIGWIIGNVSQNK